MIALLRGTIVHHTVAKANSWVLVEVNGVGYRVWTTQELAAGWRPQSPAVIYTFHKVAEDLNDLYGFPSVADVDFFKLLISISGIGPKSALDVLDKVRRHDIVAAAATQNTDGLVQAGLGAKTAQKIITGLEGKVDMTDVGSNSVLITQAQVVEALIGLGYSPRDARDATQQTSGETIEDHIKNALKQLSQ